MSTRIASNRQPGVLESMLSESTRAKKSPLMNSQRRCGQFRAQRHQPAAMPVDHVGQRLDHQQRAHRRVPQHRARRVAEPEAADHHFR